MYKDSLDSLIDSIVLPTFDRRKAGLRVCSSCYSSFLSHGCSPYLTKEPFSRSRQEMKNQIKQVHVE